jgi:hypothetical protein
VKKCPNCNGRGHWLGFYSRPLWFPCTPCLKTGWVEEDKEVDAEIPGQGARSRWEEGS